MRFRSTRAAIFVALVAGVMVYAPAQKARPARSAESTLGCLGPDARIDVAFIIDRSGSLDAKAQGQTYNIEIEGVRRALLDPGVIARDGSIGVAIFTFAGDPSLRVPFTEIKSTADAEALAAAVETLRCVSDDTCPQQGPNPETNCGPALLKANELLDKNGRSGARRILLVSTDGGFTDDPFFEIASNHVRQLTEGLVASEIDAILVGIESDRELNKSNAERIVFPEPKQSTERPTDALPGAVLPIKPGECNKAGADKSCADLSASQVVKFAEYTRSVLRSPIAKRFLTVNTALDTPSPVTGDTLSLRQAIDIANLNGGATTITFAKKVRSITLVTALPALVSPEITIDGIGGCEDPICVPVTIQGLPGPPNGEPPGDGILIRSNRNVVRGLRIIGFERAGVAIEPRCPLIDNIGFNRIERNVFENNTKAGVLVIDPPPPMMDQPNAVRHNIGNTISMNDISGSETPIDLGGDGPTANDPGDTDEGPNTLLNFPDTLTVTNTADGAATASSFRLSGQVNGATAAGGTVEIFAITSFRAVQSGRAINGVTFLTSIPVNADGSFTVMGLAGPLPCCVSATVTDLAGNTSELMFPGSGFPKMEVTEVTFPAEAPNLQLPQTKPFTIENTGCAPLAVSVESIQRFPGNQGKDDRFSIVPQTGAPDETIIEAGQIRLFNATFTPLIPMAVSPKDATSASLLLPDRVESTATLKTKVCGDRDATISLVAKVDTQVKLIDPNKPQNPALVTLTRSGDLFTVVFAIFDSDLDVDSVTYQFLDKSGGTVRLNQPQKDLSGVIRSARVVKGQSFRVVQTFSNAKQHLDVASVLVMVSDKQGSKDSASGSLTSQTTAAGIKSLPRAPTNALVLPVVNLTPVRDGNALPLKDRTISGTQERKPARPKAADVKGKQP